jgi:hypothetical protein
MNNFKLFPPILQKGNEENLKPKIEIREEFKKKSSEKLYINIFKIYGLN